MARETTPKSITDTICTFCQNISSTDSPSFIQVHPFPGMQVNECFPNVQKVLKKLGGRSITGWAIWQWANIMIEAEAHAIWESPDGQLIDVTPHNYEEKTILFLPDSSVNYAGTPIPNHRLSLTDSPLVIELISLFNQRDQIAANSSGQTYTLPIELCKRISEIQQSLHRVVGRNDPCPCGSGPKYKKCCGHYN